MAKALAGNLEPHLCSPESNILLPRISGTKDLKEVSNTHQQWLCRWGSGVNVEEEKDMHRQ